MENSLYTKFLASTFRSVRFGITEAHGKGIAMQFNYLTDEGAFEHNESDRNVSVNQAKVKEAVRKLTNEIMTISGRRLLR
jgi:hypothetical protein